MHRDIFTRKIICSRESLRQPTHDEQASSAHDEYGGGEKVKKNHNVTNDFSFIFTRARSSCCSYSEIVTTTRQNVSS